MKIIKHVSQTKMIQKVMSLSAWGFVMVISSILLGGIGLKIDTWLGTPPLFMTGLFLLSFFLVIMRLYNEAMNQIKKN